jgi:signal transduction histidine kinase
MVLSGSSVGTSVLSRAQRIGLVEEATLASSQAKVDGLVSRFVDEAANPSILASLVMGGMAYRLGRVGIMGLNVGASFNMPLRMASIAVGLGSEVTAFEFTNRSLISLGERAGLKPAPTANLWNWSGPGGWREGWLHSFLTFGLLKGAGHFIREENILLQHAFQSTALVTGQHMAQGLGLSPAVEGSLAEQFLQAETTNLQMGAGLSLVHAVAPGLTSLERRIDLSLRSNQRTDSLGPFRLNSMALEGLGSSGGPRESLHEKIQEKGRFVAMSSSQDPEDPPPPSQPPVSAGETSGTFANRLLDQEPIMILFTDSKQEIVYANREARRVLSQDPIGKKITDLLQFDETKSGLHYRLTTETGLDLLWEDRPHIFVRGQTAHYLLDVTGKEETERLLEELKIKASESHFGREVIHDARSALSPSAMLMGRLVDQLETLFPEEAQDPNAKASLDSPLQLAKLVKDSVRQTMEIFNTGMNILRGGLGEVALDQILLDAINLNQPLREKNNIQITMEIPAQLGIYGNKRGLLEVLNNLLVNACEAMPEGGHITLKAYPSGRQAVIEVVDSGPGIPATIRQRIFDPGFTTKAETGSGIGLSTVKKIVEQLHHGSIEVVSEEGEGTAFRIRLPLSSSSHPPALEKP